MQQYSGAKIIPFPGVSINQLENTLTDFLKELGYIEDGKSTNFRGSGAQEHNSFHKTIDLFLYEIGYVKYPPENACGSIVPDLSFK